MTTNKKSELLLPAGSLERLKTAFLYGADAVYCGTPDMSLRAKAKFTLDEMEHAISYAHDHGKKVYLALNLYTHNKDIEKLPLFAETIKKLNPDGMIIADPGVFKFMKENTPNIPLHVSTQANVCSWQTADFWYDIGASLCVLGREVSFEELKEVRAKTNPNLKLEAFVHGSMCMSYSGRCLLSNFLTERSSNQGNCAHSCRWNYKLYLKPNEDMIETNTIKQIASELEIPLTPDTIKLFDFYLEESERPNEFMKLEEDSHGAYILNSKDMCLLPKLPQILDLGIDSLKIEGRNKSEYYAGITAHAYRFAIDDYYTNPKNWSPDEYQNELNTLQNRGYTFGFFDGNLTHHANDYTETRSHGNYKYTARILNHSPDGIEIEIKNSFNQGDILEFISPTTLAPYLIKMTTIINTKNNEPLNKVNVNTPNIIIPYEVLGFDKLTTEKLFPKFTLIRKKYTT